MRTNQQNLTSPSGYCLVNDSAGEPARQQVRGRVCDQSASVSEFEVGVATSGGDIPGGLPGELWLRVSIVLA